MNQRLILAIVLSVVIMTGWEYLVLSPMYGNRELRMKALETAPRPESPPTLPSKIENGRQFAPSQTSAPSESVTLETPLARFEFTNQNAWLREAVLKDHEREDENGKRIPLTLSWLAQTGTQGSFDFDDAKASYLRDVTGRLSKTNKGLLWTYEDANIHIQRHLEPVDKGLALKEVFEVALKSRDLHPQYLFISLYGSGEKEETAVNERQLGYASEHKLKGFLTRETVPLKTLPLSEWLGIMNRYFMLSISPQTPVHALIQPQSAQLGRMSLVYPFQGSELKVESTWYFGSKSIPIFKQVDPALETSLDFGFLSVVVKLLLTLLTTLERIFHNYGLAVIGLTLVIRLFLFPIHFQSMKSMRRLSKLQPGLKKIRETCAGDNVKMQQETMQYMSKHKANPLSGCFMAMAQLPVFFAMMTLISNAIELYHAPFFWIKDLSAPDPFYILPMIGVASQFLHQRMMPATGMDPAQQKILNFMPLLFGFIMIKQGAALSMYMSVQALVGILMQLFINKALSAYDKKLDEELQGA